MGGNELYPFPLNFMIKNLLFTVAKNMIYINH